MPKSKSDVHVTPDRVYSIIDTFWDLKKDDLFDPCPVSPDFDGLEIDWKNINYVNPPYTKLSEFVEKALEEKLKGNRTIMLLPAKTDQPWFHRLVHYWCEIVWIQGRLKFKNNKWSATQPHFLVMIK